MNDANERPARATTVHSIPATVHGRYHVVPATGTGPAPLLLGFHGYAENGTRHLAQMRRIPGSERWCLCSVEALHRFYNPKTGEVIGSWMTKQAREQAIEDNVRYVSSVVDAVGQDHALTETVVVIGFSQGVAMTYRAGAALGARCQGIVALAGDVPSDVAESGTSLPPVLIGRGTGDDWYTEAKMDADCAALARCGVTPEVCVFEAGHVWTTAFREAAGEFLRQRAAAA